MMQDWLLNKIRNALIDPSVTIGTQATYLAVGTGDNTESGQDTELQTEIHRKALEYVDETEDRSVVYYCTMDTTEANDSIREVGIFDESSGGNMHIRIALPSNINKTSSVELRTVVTVELESI